MEFLKEEFKNELSAEITPDGLISVSGFTITPSEIFENSDQIAFEEAFSEWCLQRREQSLEKAAEILTLYDNHTRFPVLKTSYQQGAVIPFVGAGLSVPSGFPGWTAFLKELCNHSSFSSEELTILLESNQYEEAAQQLADSMPVGAFNEAIENTYMRDVVEVSGTIRYLPTLFDCSVITTNFDDLIKRVYDENRCSFKEVLLGGDAIEFPRQLGQGKNVLVQLHGKATSSKNRILTTKEYDAHYSEENELLEVIRAISTKTLLFLGCSLGVDRTVKQLKNIVQEKGAESTSRHYAFLPIENDQERLKKRDILAEANIYPIWYSADDDHDECLVALLELMRDKS